MTFQHERPTLDVRQKERSNAVVIPNQITLRDSIAGPQDKFGMENDCLDLGRAFRCLEPKIFFDETSAGRVMGSRSTKSPLHEGLPANATIKGGVSSVSWVDGDFTFCPPSNGFVGLQVTRNVSQDLAQRHSVAKSPIDEPMSTLDARQASARRSLAFNGGMRPMTKTECVIYGRVSTSDQQIESQLIPVRQYIDAQDGWRIVGEFLDVGVSGRKDKRPRLDDLMRAARRKEFSVLVIYKLDRLGRSAPHLLKVLGEFKSLNIRLVSVTQHLDSDSAVGKMIYGVLSVFAEFEADLIRERILIGRDRARLRGQRLGRERSVDYSSLIEKRRAGATLADLMNETGLSKRQVSRITASAITAAQ
jgi:putative DNA-invertase from lambdoid prophage Rac